MYDSEKIQSTFSTRNFNFTYFFITCEKPFEHCPVFTPFNLPYLFIISSVIFADILTLDIHEHININTNFGKKEDKKFTFFNSV